MKTISYTQLVQITAGQTLRHPHRFVPQTFPNYGQLKLLTSRQLYFVAKERSWDLQKQALQRTPPQVVFVSEENRMAALRQIPARCGIIVVKNTYQAFFRLSHWSYRHYRPLTIAISGSAGKSTTTAMMSSILRQQGPLVQTFDNLNTAAFLPRYLCQVDLKHRYLLLEMGMDSLGNIRSQCRIVRPEIAALTNVGEAHAGQLGGLQKVAMAKQELVEGVRPQGTLFLNADDAGTQRLKPDRCPGKVYTFGINRPATIRGSQIRSHPWGMSFMVSIQGKKYPFRLPVHGRHNVYNALTAIALAHAAKITIPVIQKGLLHFRTPRMRQQWLAGRRGEQLINDAWNANPASMAAGLEVLHSHPTSRYKIAVLGDMLGLGDIAPSRHYHLGQKLAKFSIHHLIVYGNYAPWVIRGAVQKGYPKEKITWARNPQSIIRKIQSLPAQSLIYFKASRYLRFEKIVRALKK